MGMTIPGAVAVLAEGEAGGSNFLIPNGTFFFVLAISLPGTELASRLAKLRGRVADQLAGLPPHADYLRSLSG